MNTWEALWVAIFYSLLPSGSPVYLPVCLFGLPWGNVISSLNVSGVTERLPNRLFIYGFLNFFFFSYSFIFTAFFNHPSLSLFPYFFLCLIILACLYSFFIPLFYYSCFFLFLYFSCFIISASLFFPLFIPFSVIPVTLLCLLCLIIPVSPHS